MTKDEVANEIDTYIGTIIGEQDDMIFFLWNEHKLNIPHFGVTTNRGRTYISMLEPKILAGPALTPNECKIVDEYMNSEFMGDNNWDFTRRSWRRCGEINSDISILKLPLPDYSKLS